MATQQQLKSLAKARAAKANAKAPNQTAAGQPETYQEAFTDDETVAFCEKHLQGKAVESMTEDQIAATIRYARIVQSKKKEAEHQGFAAELEVIRKQIAAIERKYAIAQLLAELNNTNLRDVQTRRESDIPFQLIIKIGEEELPISYESIKEAYGPNHPAAVKTFNAALNSICTMLKSGYNGQYARVNTSNGRAWGLPFDFQSPLAHIKAHAADSPNN